MASSSLQGTWTPGRSETAPRPGVLLTDILLVGMALLWGVNYSVVKLATNYFEPLVFNASRVILATIVLAVMALFYREYAPTRRQAGQLVLLGMIGQGAYQALFVLGLARTSVGTTALILAASPAFIGIVARLLGVEHPSRRVWFAIGLQIAGMLGVVLGSAVQSAPGRETSLLGPAILLVAAVMWAFYNVLLKKHTEDVHPVHLSVWTLVGGVLVLGVVALPGFTRLDVRALPPVAFGAVLYSGILAMVVAYFFYYRGLRVIGPMKTAMFSNLQPIIALVAAFVMFREVPTPLQLGGAALIMTGLLVSRT